MAEDTVPPPFLRLMNFVSQDELEEAKRNRGERVDDGTAQPDRPLYQILQENKDKKDAEFNERFKHRPPKALDEDETEFLDNLETSRKEYERLIADEEAEQLRSFQAAVAAQSMIVNEVKEVLASGVQPVQEKRTTSKKNPPAQPLGMIIKVKPQKKARIEPSSELESGVTEKASAEVQQHSHLQKSPSNDEGKLQEPPKNLDCARGNIHEVPKTGLVSYSDESDDDY